MKQHFLQFWCFCQTWNYLLFSAYWAFRVYSSLSGFGMPYFFFGPSFFYADTCSIFDVFLNMKQSTFSSYMGNLCLLILESGLKMLYFLAILTSLLCNNFYTKKPLGNHILFLLQMAWKSPSWCWTLEWKWIHNTTPQRCLCPDDWTGKTRILCSISWRIVSYLKTHFSKFNYHKVTSIIACLQYENHFFS